MDLDKEELKATRELNQNRIKKLENEIKELKVNNIEEDNLIDALNELF